MSKRRRIPAAEPDRQPPPPTVANPWKTGCVCLNHKGTPKQQHKTRDAALALVLERIRGGGAWTAYPCPTSGRWHVAQTPDSISRATRG